MKKTIRISLLLITFLLLAICIAIVIGIYKPRAYEGVLSSIIYEKTGLQYSTREISVQLSPTIINLKGLELSNPEWVQDPKLFSAENIEVALNVKQFINKKKPFWSAVLNDLDIQLLEDEKNRKNWPTNTIRDKSNQEVKEPLVLSSLLSFSEINIHQAKLTQLKQGVSEEIDVSNLLVNRLSDISVQLKGTGLYKQQRVDIHGNIDINDQNPTEEILNFSIQANGLGIALESTGSVATNNIDKANVSISAKSENLEKLEAFFETTFPAVTPLHVELDLLSSKDSYELSKINLQMGENILTGDMLFNPNKSFLRVNLLSEKINLMPYVLAQTSEGAEPVEAEEKPHEAEIDWTWMETINAEVNLEVGEVSANDYSLKDINTSLRLSDSVFGIDKFSAYLQQLTSDSEQPFESGLIKISGTLSPLARKTQGSDVELSIMVSENDSSLILNGEANLNGMTGNALKVNADFNNLDSISNYLQTDLSPYFPARVEAIIETTEHKVTIDKLLVTSAESDVLGDIKVDWSNEGVSVTGELKSELLDLSSVLANKNNDTEDKKMDAEGEKVFSDEVINWTWLDTYKAKLDLMADKLIINENIFHKVKTNLEIANGSLNIKPLHALFADGSVKSELSLDKFGDGVQLSTQLDAINLSLSAMGATDDSVLEGGTTDLIVKLDGQGKSLHQIMSSLNGEVVAEVQKGIIKNDTFEAIGTDIILEMLTMLNPFMKEDETTELECAAVKFSAENGVLTSKNQLAIETSKMKIVGGGIVDLNSEELEIGFSPSAKKGIGINVGSLVKFVRLGGTLKNPQPEADPVGMLKSGAALGAAVSTGGLSLLVEGLFKRAANSGSACNQALKDTIDQEESIDANASDNAP